MAFSPENNPRMPGDPYSYDLKWVVEEINSFKSSKEAAETAAANAQTSADNAAQQAGASEAWAVGTIDGEAVPADAPQHENNSKYYAEQAANDAARIETDLNIIPNIEARIDTNANDIDILSARVDSFASLPAGSTAGNAELLDIRIDKDGHTWPSAGDAVRAQASNEVIIAEDLAVGSGTAYLTGFDIDRSYPDTIIFKNNSASPAAINAYYTLSGGIVPSSAMGSITLAAGAEHVWTHNSLLNTTYGASEPFFKNTVALAVDNPNGMDIRVTVKQQRNADVDAFRSQRTVICNPASSGGGIFINIQHAIDHCLHKWPGESCIVYLQNGIYNLNYVSSRPAVINKGANRVNIIGESRDGVKLVLVSTPAQNNKIIEHGGPSMIANISFYNLWNDDGSTYNYSNNSYCIHNDNNYASATDWYETVVKNCYIYSEAFAPIGSGLWQYQKQRYINCECVFNSADPNTSGYNQWAPIYVHGPSQIAVTDCAVEIDGCTCRAEKGTRAIVLSNVPGMLPYTSIPTTIRRTIGVTNGASVSNISSSTHDLQPDCALNNVSAWNMA